MTKFTYLGKVQPNATALIRLTLSRSGSYLIINVEKATTMLVKMSRMQRTIDVTVKRSEH
jgi:hypothetical protein